MFRKLLHTNDSSTVIIIRLIVGAIFLSEGIQKIIYPQSVGTGRFEKIGFEYPEFWAHFTASFEIICGSLVLVGFLTRLASIQLLSIMITAFFTTKYPILIDKGFWAMAHEYRTDFSMTLGNIFLLVTGGGKWSVDLLISKQKWK